MLNLEPLLTKAEARRRLPPPAMRRAIREAAGRSQEDLADAFVPPIHRETISRWERGEREPCDELLPGYVELLDKLREIASS